MDGIARREVWKMKKLSKKSFDLTNTIRKVQNNLKNIFTKQVHKEFFKDFVWYFVVGFSALFYFISFCCFCFVVWVSVFWGVFYGCCGHVRGL